MTTIEFEQRRIAFYDRPAILNHHDLPSEIAPPSPPEGGEFPSETNQDGQNSPPSGRLEGAITRAIPTTLVLLHGLCEDSTIWHDFIQDLPTDWRIVMIDLPGFGASEVVADWTIPRGAQAVVAVLDALGIEKCVLIGHSMGGYIAAAFADLFSTRLQGLGFFHAHPFEDTAERKAGRHKAIDFIEKNGSVLYVKQLIPSLFAPLFATSNQFLIDAMILRAVQFPAQGIIEAQRAMLLREDRSVALTRLDCPVLFIIGKQDTVIPYDLSLAQTHLPKVASIHILPKVAHMGMFRAKEETVRIVRDFVLLAQGETSE